MVSRSDVFHRTSSKCEASKSTYRSDKKMSCAIPGSSCPQMLPSLVPSSPFSGKCASRQPFTLSYVSTLSLKTAGSSVGRAVARKSGVLFISLPWVASLVFSLLTFLLPAVLRHRWHGFTHRDTKMSPISLFSLISRCCCCCIDHFIASF